MSATSARLPVDIRRFPWINRLAADYAYNYARLADAYAGNPAEPSAWADAIVRTQQFTRQRDAVADLLGAQIMAGAGYDPRRMANMFRTIEKQSGGGGPEWLSSHPNPGNRYEAIQREAANLRIQGTAPSQAPPPRRGRYTRRQACE